MRRGLSLLLAALLLAGLAACAPVPPQEEETITGSMPLEYAEHFAVDYCTGGAALLTVAGRDRYLLLPEGAQVPGTLSALPRIPIPAERIYLASSSVADLFVRLDALDAVRFTATGAESWQLPELREALDDGGLLYAGKYSAPDYELLLTEGCSLAVENTMILHKPSVKEKLESLGLPVLVEYSSYEPHPLGRVEWIKLYGLLTGRLDEAERFFARQLETLRALEDTPDSGKRVAFFHITANGSVVVRKREDYVTRMIEMAGAETAITQLPEEENALSTMNIQMESFYAQARDADILIYNSTVSGDVRTMEDFLRLSPLLADCRAVREGEVWCTELSMFQRSSAAAEMIAELHAVVSGEAEDQLQYLHRIR